MSERWGMELGSPCTLAIARDRTSDDVLHLHDPDGELLQVSIGAGVLLLLELVDGGTVTVRGADLGEVLVDGVIGLQRLQGVVLGSAEAVRPVEPNAFESPQAAGEPTLSVGSAPLGERDAPDVVDVSVFDDSVLDAPGLAGAVSDSPVLSWAALDAPVLDAPVFDAPVLDAPVFDAPVLDAPVFDAPVLGEGAVAPFVPRAVDAVAAPFVPRAVDAVAAPFVPRAVDAVVAPVVSEAVTVAVDPGPPVSSFESALPFGREDAYPHAQPESAESVAAFAHADEDGHPPESEDGAESAHSGLFDAWPVDAEPVDGLFDMESTVPNRLLPLAAVDSGEPDFAATVVRKPTVAANGILERADHLTPGPAHIRVIDAAGVVEHELAGVMYVGRAPELPGGSDPRRSSLVPVVSPSGAVAPTQIQLTVGEGLVLVDDLGSVGWTIVEQPSRSPFRLRDGAQIPLAHGARILLGDGVVLEIGEPWHSERGALDRASAEGEADMAVTFLLEFSDGQRVETSGNGVIGRNPAVYAPGTEFDDPAHVELVTVADDAKSVSRAHLAFGQYGGVFWVMDLGSANGTTITYPGEGTFACDANTRHEVDPGSIVRFGNASFVLTRR